MIQSKNGDTYTKSETEIQKFVDRLADFDTIVDCLDLDRSYFYNSFDPDSEFFINNTLDLPICLWAHDENHTVLYGNKLFMEKFDKSCNQKCHECLMDEGEKCDCCQTGNTATQNGLQKCHLCKRKENGYDIDIYHTSMKNRYGKRIFLKISFHVDDAKAVLEGYYARQSRKSTKRLLLTICSGCHKIKNPRGKWVNIDERVLSFFDGKLSHGLCLECIDILYPNLKISSKPLSQKRKA
ncbi:MAG: hypothetical protein ACI8ZB_002961 [Desulforhopalus sp.]|jgi:hypothetical protein